MMIKKFDSISRRFAYILLMAAAQLVVFSCSKDDPEPTKGKLTGQVTAAQTSESLPDVRVVVFNADDNSPTGDVLKTDASGNFSVDLLAGNYFLKFSKQGFEAIPPPSIAAVAFSVVAGGTTEQAAEMVTSGVMGAGFISGKVTGGTSALVVAEDGVNKRAFSSVSGADGTYVIFNVPAGQYSVKAYVAGYSSSSEAATVTSANETANVNLTLASGATGKLSGSVRNLAASNKDVDISLVHQYTNETIPGLTTTSVNLAYNINGIPDGTYIARATFKNDERVMDPDRIAKFGEPVVVFTSNNTQELTFDITGAVVVNSPTNDFSTTQPAEISSTTPTFTWTAYSSTSDYVIEVTDAATGTVVWGGFDKTGELPVKKIVIPSATKSIQFNSDGKASINALVPGRVYRWRVFASKDDQNSTTGWTLISASEDQRGLIKVVQ